MRQLPSLRLEAIGGTPVLGRVVERYRGGTRTRGQREGDRDINRLEGIGVGVHGR